jgi:hypothetical protein
VIGGLPGMTKTPVVLSVADVIVVCCSCKDWRLVHGVAIAGVVAIATQANRPIAAPTR